MTAYLRAKFDKLLSVNASAHQVAMGFAIGAFIGIFPTFWLGGLIAVGVCALFRLNYASAILGSVIVMNPVTTPVFWALSAGAGSLIFRDDSQAVLEMLRQKMLFKSFSRFIWVYLAGNIAVATAVSSVSYFVIKKWVRGRKHLNDIKCPNP